MSQEAFARAIPIVEAWLTEHVHAFDTLVKSDTYSLWVYERDARTHGSIELLDDKELSQRRDSLSFSVALALPPLRSIEDAKSVLSLNEYLTDATIVMKDFGEEDEATFSLQRTMPLSELSAATLQESFKRLIETQAFVEEA
ncbi:MAG: hypothetical protein RR268_03005 [Kiritimatiellia bacterium]